eukprot:c5330_g1_i1.p1 GENE.c5330_g1_i1~~c5330_g1_i1.p1  ORF type:complete len:297 (+),score=34.69 c5330_g1_i1:101-991(+)
MVSTAIRCKEKRKEVYKKERLAKKKEKKEKREQRKKEAEALGDEAPPKQIPKTLDNTREHDETVVQPDDEEVQAEESKDEFASYFNGKPPRILLTATAKPSKPLYKFMMDILYVFPRICTFYERMGYEIKEIVQYATSHGFTDIIMLNEDRKKPNALYLVHLPDGPTYHFKLSTVTLAKDINNHARPSLHPAELILTNFTTRLGLRVGRALASLFPQAPDFRGRRVVTFHNQRDFLFFRHHRYVFDSEEKARLQEIGPRFTLKLKSIQKGTFDTKFGEYEWKHTTDMDTSRRRFFL